MWMLRAQGHRRPAGRASGRRRCSLWSRSRLALLSSDAARTRGCLSSGTETAGRRGRAMGAAVDRRGRLLSSDAAMTSDCHVWRNPVRAVVMFGAIPVKDYSLASCPGLFTRAWGWRRKARATTMTAIGAISISHQTVNRWRRQGWRPLDREQQQRSKPHAVPSRSSLFSLQVDSLVTPGFIQLSAPNLVRALMLGSAEGQRRPESHVEIAQVLQRFHDLFGVELRPGAFQPLRQEAAG